MCYAIATQSATYGGSPRTLFLPLIPSKIGFRFETQETLIFKGSPIVSPHRAEIPPQPLLKVLDIVDWLFYRLPIEDPSGYVHGVFKEAHWGVERESYTVPVHPCCPILPQVFHYSPSPISYDLPLRF